MRSAVVVVAAVLVACGSTPHRLEGQQETGDVLVAASGNEAAIAKLIRGKVISGGLWFSDPECVRKFPVAGEIKGDRLDAFARCLAGLHWQKSARIDAFIDVALLTYAPGFEIEALILDDRDGPHISWIGYSSRHDLGDALPTVAPEALEPLRTKGDPNGPIAPEALAALSEGKAAFAWVKVCIDTEGNVTGAHPREATSMAAARAFGAAAQTWQFKPFVVGNRAIPACALMHMRAQPDPKPTPEMLPMLSSEEEVVVIPPNILEARRIKGNRAIYPSDRTKVEIQTSGTSRVVGSYKLCLDTSGHVEHVKQIRSTGFAAYDSKIVREISTWVYTPFMDEGKPTPVCTAVTFIYTQK